MKCYLKCLKKNVSKMSEKIVGFNVQMIVHVCECETLCVFMLTNLAFVSVSFQRMTRNHDVCDAMRGFVSRVTRNLWMLARWVMALCVMSACGAASSGLQHFLGAECCRPSVINTSFS